METSSEPRVPETLRNIVDLLENISDGLFALDPEWRFIYLNGPAERILGKLGKEVDGKVFWEVFPGFLDTVFQSEFERVLRKGVASKFEAYSEALDAWFSASVHPADEGIAVYLRDVTSRHRLNDALETSELRLKTMVSRLPIGAVFREVDQLWLNPAAEKLLLYRSEEIPTIDKWFELLHPDSQVASRERYEEFRRNHFSRLEITSLKRKDGAHLQIQMIAYADEKGEFWLLHDMTERTLTEQKFRVLFEHSKTAYFLFSGMGIVDCNEAALTQLGIPTKTEAMGRSLISLSPEIQADGLSSVDRLNLVNQALTTDGQHTFNWTHFRADGSLAEVVVSVSRFVVNHETLELVVWQDQSDIREAEDKLRQSEDRYRTILENTDEIIYTLSLDGVFTFVAPSWTRHLGHPVDQVIGKAFVDFVHPDDVLKGKNYTYRLFKDPAHRRSCQYRAIHADGSVRWHESTGSVVMGADGQPAYFVGVSRDVSDQRQASIALEEARDAALASSRAKSQFLATVSHEIRTPLNGVMGMTNLLATTPLTKEQEGYLRTIQSSGEILRRVIDDVLDYSRIEAGKLTITPIAVDVIGAIQDVVSLFQGRAQEKEIHLSLDCGSLITLHVYADPARVKQVVANLVSNAVKFTEAGFVRVVAQLIRETPTAMILRIEVADSGIGIPVDRVEAIFEDFTQADNSMQRRFGGSGLGLTICKRLTDLMGGIIGVESETGRGSRFWVELPLAKIAAAKAKKSPDLRSFSLEGRRVLLAEDNEINVEVAKRQIELLGCSVDVAMNGLLAVNMSHEQEYDVILMDVQMPEMDGLEATRAIRKRETGTANHVPIIALTATVFAEDKKACEDAGMDAFLSKPFKREDLEKFIKQWVFRDVVKV